MSGLLEKIQAANETWIEGLGGRSYRYRVPTKLWVGREAERRREQKLANLSAVDYLAAGLIGWKGVTELDLIPSGTGAEAPFDLETAMYWLENRTEDLNDLCGKVIDAINARYAALEQLEKKS